MKFTSLFVLLLISFFSLTQKQDFYNAYQQFPYVTPGILESISYTNTHLRNVEATELESCTGMPLPFGIMGVFDNGKGYFRENAKLLEKYSGISIIDQKMSVEKQIAAYASTFNALMKIKTNGNVKAIDNPLFIHEVLMEITEIPTNGIVNQYARNAFTYQVFQYLMDVDFSANYSFNPYKFDLSEVYGKDNLKVLSGRKVFINSSGIVGDHGKQFDPFALKSSDYAPALWNPAASCNFSSRAGTAISAVTIHTVQGTYAGCISWFQNCNASVSAHYVIRSSDGQVTQMVLEVDKAWHVGTENPYTIGYEHEGYVNDASWYTNAMYTSSADLSRDITTSGYGISPVRTFFGDATTGVNVVGNCTKIKGHQHYANQTHTDPGINWDWEKYYKLINNNPSITTISNTSGSFYDTGGATNNYADDERKLWLFNPSNVSNVTLNFVTFNVEVDWDFMFIYDGSTTNAPLIGKYTGTQSPGIVTSTGTTILVEFRSDCATTAPGWSVAYSSTPSTNDNTPPSISIANGPTWETMDFSQGITDSDNESGVSKSFYLIGDRAPSSTSWHSNGTYGFVNEDFSETNTYWTQQSGSFVNSSGGFLMNDANQNNSNAYLNVVQNANSDYLFCWDQKITTSLSNQRAGMHFFCSDPILPNRGNSYFIFFRDLENVIQFYEVTNDVFTIVHEVNFDVVPNTNYSCKVWYNPISGLMKLYVDEVFIGEWTDSSPLTSGNSISLRSGGCEALFDNVRVFRSRGNSVNISVGTNSEVRFQSENAQHTGRINTLAVDNEENWSTIASKDYLIDWTSPTLDYVNDGGSSDIDTTFNTTLESNWSFNDIHSDISNYEWALGTSLGSTDVMNWTSSGTSTTIQHLLNNPIYNQTYYFSTRAINGAGLLSEANSDGQLLLEDNVGLYMNSSEFIGVYPNPSHGEITLHCSDNATIIFFDQMGKKVSELKLLKDTPVKLELAQGIYNAMVVRKNLMQLKRIVIQ